MMRRYHRKFGFPANTPLRPPSDLIRCITRHAEVEAARDNVTIPLIISPLARCIDITVNEAGGVWRWLMRQYYDVRRDVLLVVESDGTLVSCWTNHRLDFHHSLDRMRYESGEVFLED